MSFLGRKLLALPFSICTSLISLRCLCFSLCPISPLLFPSPCPCQHLSALRQFSSLFVCLWCPAFVPTFSWDELAALYFLPCVFTPNFLEGANRLIKTFEWLFGAVFRLLWVMSIHGLLFIFFSHSSYHVILWLAPKMVPSDCVHWRRVNFSEVSNPQKFLLGRT